MVPLEQGGSEHFLSFSELRERTRVPWSSSRRDVFGVVGGFLLSGSYFKFVIKMLGPESSNVNKDGIRWRGPTPT